MNKMEFNTIKLKKLFDTADEKIFLNKKEKLVIEDGPNQQKTRAEVYVDAIAELVYYILSKAKRKKGKVRIPLKLKKYLGKVGSGTDKTPGSYFEIDDEKLKIVLDYSNQYRDGMMVTWDAKSRVKYNCEKDDFYSESGIVPREQISNALDAYGFGMHYEAGELVSEDKSILIEVEVYTIIVKRVKEKTDDSKQYTKK